MWVPWPYTMVAAATLAAGGWLLRPRSRVGIAVRPFALEASLVCVLYSLWRIAGGMAVRHADGAEDRALDIWHLQRWLHLPSELAMQRAVLPHPEVVQAANAYYAILHVPAIIAVLLWLFIWHREDYPPIRNVLALVTGACLAIQLVAVAPPRFLPQLGFVDTGHLYGQSVYTQLGTGAANQMSAMPSVHVGWAVLVAFAVIVASSSRWRWLIVAHPVATGLAVVVTANHWWMDGIVAVAILAVAVVGERRARALLAPRWTRDLVSHTEAQPEPAHAGGRPRDRELVPALPTSSAPSPGSGTHRPPATSEPG